MSKTSVMTAKTHTDPATVLPPWLLAELRSDHAGELGAVMIYQGILFSSKNPVVRDFAAEHLATEREHLALMEDLLAPKHRSRLQWPWRGAGWLIGAIPAAINSQWVFATIATVEAFVDKHYSEQLDRLTRTNANQVPAHIGDLLDRCRADEVQHQQDAAGRISGSIPVTLRAWLKLVEWGSRGAVVVARAI
jgi:ubiquinone biosynthesis monooxygenase Coq7